MSSRRVFGDTKIGSPRRSRVGRSVLNVLDTSHSDDRIVCDKSRSFAVVVVFNMSRAPSISQLLKQAGLVRRPRAGRPPAAASGTRTRGRKRSRLGDTIDSGSTGDSNVVNDKGEEKEEEGNGETASSTLGSGDSGIDDQIAALERELEGGSTGINASGSDDSDDSDEDGDSSGSEREDHDEPSENGTRSNGVANGRKKRAHKIVSPLDSEKIQPLPAHLLPRPGCGVAKSNKSLKKSKKRPRVDVDTPSGSATPGPSRGLDSAVKELMANYEARSSERVPFYCRVCQFQGER